MVFLIIAGTRKKNQITIITFTSAMLPNKNKCIMQVNVNAENVLNSIVNSFGEELVSTCDGGVIKLQVKSLANGDILTISNMLQWADIQIKRSNTKLLILFIPKEDSHPYSVKLLKQIESIESDIIED